MTQRKTTIFRPEAVRRYIESQEKAVLPRLVSPRAFAGLWGLFALSLALLAAAAALARVPEYADGAGVLAGALQDPGNSGALSVVALLPAAQPGRLQVGQAVFLLQAEKSQPLRGQVTTVEPGLLDPAEALERFGLDTGLAAGGPVAVVTVQLDALPAATLAQLQTTRVYRVRVEIGVEPALTLLARQLGVGASAP